VFIKSNVSERFTFQTSENSETLSAHLIRRDYWTNGTLRGVLVTSHIDIPATGSIWLRPEELPILPPTSRFLKVVIQGLGQSVEKVEQGGENRFFEKVSASKMKGTVVLELGETLYLKVFGKQETREIVLPEASSADSIVLQWEQLKPLGTQSVNLKLPEMPWAPEQRILTYIVRGTSPDTKQWMTILKRGRAYPDSTLAFNLPFQFDPTWSLHVSAKNDFCHVVQRFQPGEASTLSLPSARVTEADDRDGGKLIRVRHTGDADMLRAYTRYNSSNGVYVDWQIDAAPQLFEKMLVPHLDKYFPQSIKSTDVFKNHFFTEAFRSGAYGYAGMVTGLPWQKLTPFPFSDGEYGWIMVP
jgi:hypothetical protein